MRQKREWDDDEQPQGRSKRLHQCRLQQTYNGLDHWQFQRKGGEDSGGHHYHSLLGIQRVKQKHWK